MSLRVGDFVLHRPLHEGSSGRYDLATHVDERRRPGPFVVFRFTDHLASSNLADALSRRAEVVLPRVSKVVAHAAAPVPFAAFEYVAGVSAKRLPSEVTLPTAARIVAEVARILDEAAPRIGYDALDIDVGNVRLGWDGTVALTLPVTRLLGPADSTPTLDARANTSPESVRGTTADARSVVFTLGLLLYRLVEGRHPFSAPTPMEMFLRMTEDRPDPVAHASPELDAVLARALARDPDRRYARPRSLAESIEGQLDPIETGALGVEVSNRFASARRDEQNLFDDFGSFSTEPDLEGSTLHDEDTLRPD